MKKLVLCSLLFIAVLKLTPTFAQNTLISSEPIDFLIGAPNTIVEFLGNRGKSAFYLQGSYKFNKNIVHGYKLGMGYRFYKKDFMRGVFYGGFINYQNFIYDAAMNVEFCHGGDCFNYQEEDIYYLSGLYIGGHIGYRIKLGEKWFATGRGGLGIPLYTEDKWYVDETNSEFYPPWVDSRYEDDKESFQIREVAFKIVSMLDLELSVGKRF